MKLCPQCDFIYEDEQWLCDMDGTTLVYEPTLQAVAQTAAPQASLLPVPVLISSHSEGFDAQPRVVAAPRSFGLLIAAAFVLAALVFVVYYASPRGLRTRAQTSAPQLKTQSPEQRTADGQPVSPAENKAAPQNNSPSSSAGSDQPPVTNQSPTNPASPSSSLNQTNDQVATTAALASARSSRTAHATDRDHNGTDNRLTIPRLPPLATLPRVQPLRRLPPAKPEQKKAESASTPEKQSTSQSQAANQKLIAARQTSVSSNYKPAISNESKQSRFGSFLKKTGRMLTKPFKP
jgi:hypothetical protein